MLPARWGCLFYRKTTLQVWEQHVQPQFTRQSFLIAIVPELQESAHLPLPDCSMNLIITPFLPVLHQVTLIGSYTERSQGATRPIISYGLDPAFVAERSDVVR